MVKFNTQEQPVCCNLQPTQVLPGVFSLLKKALKIGLIFSFLLCCYWQNELHAQCNPAICTPDNCPPTVNCIGPFVANLDASGIYSLVPTALVSSYSDNCTTPTLSVVPTTLTCAHVPLSPVTLTVTATDMAGNMASCSISVTVVDPLIPSIVCPPNITIDCALPGGTSPANTGFATANDNCGLLIGPIIIGDVPIPAPGGGCSAIQRTWYAMDVNGNVATCMQIITVNDNVNPELDWNGASPGVGTPPANLTINCQDPIPPDASFTATDNCSTPTTTVLTSSTKGANPALCPYYNYTVTKTYKATDDCGNMATHVQTITVQDVTAPVFSPLNTSVIKPANATCDYTFPPGVAPPNGLALSVSDNCAAGVNITKSFAVVRNIDGVTVNSGPGLDAAGTYSAGVYTITYSASDPCGNLAFHQITMTITDNVAPVAICQLAVIQVSIPPTGTATITPAMLDNGSYDQCSPVTFSVSPNTMTCANLGPPLLDIVTLTVTDANGNTNTCTASINVVDNSAPAMLCKDITRNLDATGQVTVNAIEIDNGSYDACGIDSYEISKDGGVTFAPSATFLCPEEGDNTAILKVTDDAGNMGICTATVTIIDTIAPTAVCSPATVYLQQDGMYTLPLNQFTTTLDNMTSAAIPGSGSVSSTLTFTGVGLITDVNLLDMDISHSRVGDLSFTLTSPTGTIVSLGHRPGFPAIPIVGCTGDNILASFDDSALNPKEAFENMCNNLPAISGTFEPITPLSVFNGENVNGVWTLTVTDNLATIGGTLNSWSLQISYQRLGTTNIGFGSDDNCSFDMSISPNMFTCADINADGNPMTGLNGNEGVTYTLTVTDPSGNTGTCTSTITVLDTFPPMISCGTHTVSLNASGNYTLQPQEVLTGGIYISSGNNGSGTSGATKYCVTIPKPMTISFDFDYTTQNTHAARDPFGYTINNGPFQLLYPNNTGGVICDNVGNNAPYSGNSGPISLLGGQKFCFEALTCDNVLGRSEIWIKNLVKSAPAPAGVASEINNPAQWMQMGSFNSDGKAFFYDACYTSMDVSPNMFNCSHVSTPQTYIVTVTDKGGNTATCSGLVTVQDKQPPQAQCDEVVVNLDGDGHASIPATDFNQGSTDACCGTNLTYMASLDGGITFFPTLDITCANIGPDQMVVLKVSDCAVPPNNAFCMTTITVNDKLPPVFTMCPADVTLECDDFPATDPVPDPTITGVAMAEDNCDGMVTPEVLTPEILMPAGITTCPPNQRAAYLVSFYDGQPWSAFDIGQSNVQAMNAVFGAPNWDQMYFETAMAATLFSPAYKVIFLEGSDEGTDELNTFLQTNMLLIEAWVAAGGSLFLNAAPNVSMDVHFGFGGVVLKATPLYLNASNVGNVAVPGHPIFTGATLVPSFTPASGNYTGTDYGHAVICPPGMGGTALILTDLPNTPPTLVEMDWGFGKVMFGGMTTTNWHLPAPNADNMRRNLLSYLNKHSNCGKMTSTFFNRDCQKITRRWRATDSHNNSSLCFQNITVEDNTYPTLQFAGGFPADTTIDCHATLTPPVVTVIDNCAANHPATLREFNSTRGNDPNDCDYYSYSYQRFWTGVDNCGNTVTSDIQFITVQDTTMPVFAANTPTNIAISNDPNLCLAVVGANGILNLSGYISDNCAALANLTLSYCVYAGSPAGSLLYCGLGGDAFGTFLVGVYTIRYFAQDPCGNMAFHDLVFKVQDTEIPSPVCYPLVKPLNNNGIAIIDPSDIDLGNSDDNCGIATMTLSKSSFDCSNVGVNIVILTATDAAGNVNTCTTTVTILLPSQPGILCQNNLIVNCNDVLDPFDPLSPTDPAQVVLAGPCNGLIVPTYSDLTIIGTQPNCRTIQRTWSAAGASCVQIITVQDPLPPSFPPVALPVNVSCDNVPSAPNRTAVDDCLGNLPASPVVTSMQGANPALCSHYTYDILWQWTATDNCHSPVTVSHTVHVKDTIAPIFSFPNPLMYPADPNKCEAQVVINLLDYISDCAADQYLTVTNNAFILYGNGNGTTNINGLYAVGNYPITVTATDVCGNMRTTTFTLQVKDAQSPEPHCFNSTVVLDNTGNGDLTVSQVDNGSHDNCGPVTLSFAAPPAPPLTTLHFTTADIGTQIVTLYVTDAAGNTNTCTAIITIVDDPTFIAGNVIGSAGEMKMLPISVMNYQDIVSFQLKITMLDPSIATIVDVIPVHPSLAGGFYFTTPVPPNMVTVGWIQPLPLTGVDIPDGTILFNLKVMISNSAVAGTSTGVDIDQTTLEVGQLIAGIPVSVMGFSVDGSVHVVDMATSHTVSGELRTMPDPHPGFPVPGPDPCAPNYLALIPGVTVGYSGTLSGSIPGAPGTYSIVVPDGANLTITPSKSNPLFFGNPVTAYDAFRVQNYAVGNDPPDANPALAPLQIVAADANNDNVITQFDAVLIQSLSAQPTALPKYWRFIPELVALSLPPYPFIPGFNEFLSYTGITADITDADFIGVRVGNVFGCEDPTLFAANNSEDRGDRILFRIDDMPVVAGEEVQVVFKAKDFQELVSCQYTLNFNPQVLQYVEAVPYAWAANSTGLIFNSLRADEGMLAVSWFNQKPVNLPDGEPLFILRFKALGNAGSLKDLMSVGNDYIVMEAAKKDGTFYGVGLAFEGVTTATGEPAKGNFALYQNTPNPFGHRTAIGFSLPERTSVTLTFSDASGKVYKVIEGDFSAGYHQVFVERKDLAASGVFFYRLDTPTHTAVKKMVLVD